MGRDGALEPSAEILAQAEAINRDRFKYTDRDHPAVAALYELGICTLVQELERRPDRYDRSGEPAPSGDRKSFAPLDPMKLMQSEVQLPSLPQVVLELQELIASPDSSASDIAEVISRDVSLSAFLLRMVNSAFYSFPSQIDTISRAVALVGTQQLSTLALGTSVLGLFSDIPAHVVDMEAFWRHCTACAIISRNLGVMLKENEPERYFVAGLIHDIGHLAMFQAIPEQIGEALRRAHDQGALPYEAEREVLGFDHSRLGSMLLRKWNFPFSIVMAVLNHHSPAKAKEIRAPAIVHFADVMTHALGLASNLCFHVPPLSPEAWDELALPLEAIRELAAAREEMDALYSLLFA